MEKKKTTAERLDELQAELEALRKRVDELEKESMCNTEGLWGEDFRSITKRGEGRQ